MSTKEVQNTTRSPDEERIMIRPLESDAAPDGGVQAWTVAIGGSAIFFCCMGFSNAYGVFQEYYMSHQLRHESSDKVAWIGSLSAFIQFAVGAVAGPLFDRYGAWMMRPATVVYVFAMMMLSLCTEYWHFMLTQGLLMGAAMGLLQFPCMAAVSQHFDKKRAAALGIVVSGSSVGGIAIPIALSKMLNSSSLGFGWSVRIIGFVITPLMAFACIAIKARLPSRRTSFFIWTAFKDPMVNLLVAALFFIFMGMFTPLFFLPTYAVSQGMSVTLASYLLAILNAASTFGRIIPGVLADKYGRLNMFSVGGVASGIVILCMTKATSTAGLIVYAIAFGFTSGTIISGASAAFTICVPDPRDMGTYMGQGLAVGSLAALVGPPVNGAMVDRYGGFLEVTILSGVACLGGGFIAFLAKMVTPQGIFGRV